MGTKAVLFCYACTICTTAVFARPSLQASIGTMQKHLRGLLSKETPVHKLTWSQFSEWGIESPELDCTSPGAPKNTVTSAGFNITSGAGYAKPPLSCTAEKQWPYGYGYMEFTAVTAASESVAANFTHGLAANQIWKVSGSSTANSVPTQLYYNMNFEPTFSIRYTIMLQSNVIVYYVMKDLKVAYGPDGWWLGSDKCKTYTDESNGGAASFKCDAYRWGPSTGTELDLDKKLRLTYGLNVNQLNFSLVDAF